MDFSCRAHCDAGAVRTGGGEIDRDRRAGGEARWLRNGGGDLDRAMRAGGGGVCAGMPYVTKGYGCSCVWGGGQGRVSVLGGMPGNRDMHAGRGDVHSHSEGIADSSMSGQKSHPSAHGKTTNQSIQRDNVCS